VPGGGFCVGEKVAVFVNHVEYINTLHGGNAVFIVEPDGRYSAQ
jgi:hypothetical protein